MSDATEPPAAPTVEQRLATLEQRLEAHANALERYATQTQRETEPHAKLKSLRGRPRAEILMKLLELLAVFGGVVVGVWTIREAKHQYIETHGTTMKQLELAREQNDKLQVQIDAQREQDYIARRAELLATLYDRREGCEVREHVSGGCPHKGSRRSREEALKAFAYIEHTRPHPDLTLRGLVLPEANLAGLDLRNADLSEAELEDSHLEGTLLTHANLTNASLVRIHLEGANLDHAKLGYANLTRATLDGASLRHAQLTNAYLNEASLDHADLTGARLRSNALLTTHREGIQLQGVQFDAPAPNAAGTAANDTEHQD